MPGFALPHATASIPLAGADLSAHLIALLNAAQTHHARTAEGRAFLAAQQVDRPFEFDLTAHQDVVRDLKARRVRVLPEADAPLPRSTHHTASAAASAAAASDSVFELPDGQFVHVDQASRYRAAEILFSPSDANSAVAQGVHELAYDSIVKCDNFLQRDLFQNIVLAGGTSMLEGAFHISHLPKYAQRKYDCFRTFCFYDIFSSVILFSISRPAGFAERLQNEIQQLDRGAHAICVVQDSQRRHAAWIGGSMLASLPTFGPLKVTRAEYEESPDTVHKKYF